jgi:hypothetical protein
MSMSWLKYVVALAAVASGTVVGAGVHPSAADEPPPPQVLPAGLACEGFAVQLDAGADTRSTHTFTDANGNVVRTILAGTGSTVTLTNLSTGQALSLRGNGSVWSIVNNPDGTQTYTTMGHLVLILFPTDIPAGPSTTLYVGRVVFDVDPVTGVFTFKGNVGTATDLCAALS